MNEEQLIVKDALKMIQLTGKNGALKSDVLSNLRTPDGQQLNPEQQGVIWGTLTGRNWIVGHIEPLWHNTRWSLTVSGVSALEQM